MVIKTDPDSGRLLKYLVIEIIKYQITIFDTISNKGADLGCPCSKHFRGLLLSGYRSVLPVGMDDDESSPKWRVTKGCIRNLLKLGRYAPLGDDVANQVKTGLGNNI